MKVCTLSSEHAARNRLSTSVLAVSSDKETNGDLDSLFFYRPAIEACVAQRRIPVAGGSCAVDAVINPVADRPPLLVFEAYQWQRRLCTQPFLTTTYGDQRYRPRQIISLRV